MTWWYAPGGVKKPGCNYHKPMIIYIYIAEMGYIVYLIIFLYQLYPNIYTHNALLF